MPSPDLTGTGAILNVSPQRVISEAALQPKRRNPRFALALQRVICCLLMSCALLMPLPAKAQGQLGPADLKRVNALSANTAAWAVLRRAVAIALADAGLSDIATNTDNVDTIATVFALEDPEGRMVPVLSGAARGGIMAAARPDLTVAIGLDGARPRGLACLIFGQAPQERTLLADLVELSSQEREACASHYERIRDYWLEAAGAILRPDGAGEDTSIGLDLAPAGGPLASARSVLIAGETVNEVGYFLSRRVRFAQPLLLSGSACGGARVDVDPSSGRLILCYELFAELAQSIGQSLGG